MSDPSGLSLPPEVGERVTTDPPRPRSRWHRFRCSIGWHPSICSQMGWADFDYCNDCMRRTA